MAPAKELNRAAEVPGVLPPKVGLVCGKQSPQMRSPRLFILLFYAGCGLAAVPQTTWICPDLGILGDRSVAFTESELRLVCGDPKAMDWQKVPESQAIYALKTFLQDRGFYFSNVKSSGAKVLVELGEPTRVSSLQFSGTPPEFTVDTTERNGELLTPTLLHSISMEVQARAGLHGYACASADAQANPATGVVSVRVRAGEKQALVRIEEDAVAGLKEGTLRRYDAFELGKTFQSDLLPLTASRALADGIVSNTFFNVKCTPDGVVATQKVLGGKPRQVNLGVGMNTDRGVLVRGSWRHARLGERGSSFFASLSATYKGRDFNSQEGRLETRWYVLSQPSRFHLHPLVTFRHESDNRRDTLKGLLQAVPAITWDTQDVGAYFSLGPALNGEMTLRGVGRAQTYFLALAGEARLTSHDFEWQRTAPRSGFEVASSVSLSRKGIFADFSSQLLSFRYTHLKSFPMQGRRHLVVGLRAAFATTLFQELDGGLAQLTPGLRHYLGGSSGFRGFGFQELPDDLGGLTSVFGGLEARAAGVLPLDLQPLVFADVGSISRNAFDVTGPWYVAPGVGLRFASALGVFRTTLAHAYPLSLPPSGREHWQFHFTFGEEF